MGIIWMKWRASVVVVVVMMGVSGWVFSLAWVYDGWAGSGEKMKGGEGEHTTSSPSPHYPLIGSQTAFIYFS